MDFYTLPGCYTYVLADVVSGLLQVPIIVVVLDKLPWIPNLTLYLNHEGRLWNVEWE